MNKSRELFLLFKPTDVLAVWNEHKDEIIKQGYTLIHKHTYPNDEPPYTNVTFYREGIFSGYFDEDEESLNYYFIRVKDSNRFITLMNTYQKDYLDGWIEGVYTRNTGEHNMSPVDYANGMTFIRRPKCKLIYELPNTIQLTNM